MDGGLWRPFDHLTRTVQGPIPDEVRTRALAHALLEGNALDEGPPATGERRDPPFHEGGSRRTDGATDGGHRTGAPAPPQNTARTSFW